MNETPLTRPFDDVPLHKSITLGQSTWSNPIEISFRDAALLTASQNKAKFFSLQTKELVDDKNDRGERGNVYYHTLDCISHRRCCIPSRE